MVPMDPPSGGGETSLLRSTPLFGRQFPFESGVCAMRRGCDFISTPLSFRRSVHEVEESPRRILTFEEGQMRYQKMLNDLTETELAVLTKIIELLQQLPDEPSRYFPALGKLREKILGVPGYSAAKGPRGYASSRQIRATDNKW